jgi:malate synthase
MGGMAAQIPIKGDPLANEEALDKVRADKLREVKAGHDGTWVAHPALVPVAQAIFDAHMPTPNQLAVMREDVTVSRDQLIAPPSGTISRAGFDNNVEVSLRYTAAWLDGLGCVPIHHLMEDAATAEIARAQLWQWLHHGGLEFPDHAPIDFALFDQALAAHVHRLSQSQHPGAARAQEAAELLSAMTHGESLADFLTLPAYQRL